MSKNDQLKVKKEQDCLKTAIELASNKHNKTYEILKMLDGKPIDRLKDDKPDIVRLCVKGKSNPKEVVVGIEHFRADQLSKEKGEKRVSKTAEYTSHIRKVYEKGHDELINAGGPSNETVYNLIEQTNGILLDSVNKNYYDVVEDLSYNISNHLKKVNAYRNNLNKIANGRKIEIAFLIDLHIAMPTMFLNSENNVSKLESEKLIVFEDIAKELQQIDKKLVDYIIILYHNSRIDKATDVVAIKNGNIKNQLKRQGLQVYEYINFDKYSDSKVNLTNVIVKKNEDNSYTFRNNYRLEDEKGAERALYEALRNAYYAKKNNKPFAASGAVQAALEAFWEYIVRFERGKDGIIRPVLKLGTDRVKLINRFEKLSEEYKG